LPVFFETSLAHIFCDYFSRKLWFIPCLYLGRLLFSWQKYFHKRIAEGVLQHWKYSVLDCENVKLERVLAVELEE